MYLKRHTRKKDGKVHRYWSIVESHRLANGCSAKRQVLYLGEINDSQRLSWCKMIDAIEGRGERPQQIALFPNDRQPPADLPRKVTAIQLDLDGFELHRPRQWGACWLALKLWDLLCLEEFWQPRLPPSRKGTQWYKILQVLTCARLIQPGSEWFVHRHWYRQTALGDLLGMDREAVPKNALYHCHDHLLKHKKPFFAHLQKRWKDLFAARFEVLLYDLTSTYFECDAPENPSLSKKRYGYSRDKRPDCLQVVIALVVTPEGFPLAYEVLAGNTQDKQTLRGFLKKIEGLYGKTERIWVMDRGIPTEAVLAEMRQSTPPVHYIVGTPKGRLAKLEKKYLEQPWEQVREGVEVKLLEQSGELYVLTRSEQRVNKERGMRRRRLKRLWRRLGEIRAIKEQSREELFMRLGAAKKDAGRVWHQVRVTTPEEGQIVSAETFSYKLDRKKLRVAFRREGRYLVRAFIPGKLSAVEVWKYYMRLVEIEECFRNIKGDLALRPIHHQLDSRIEAHIFISFLAFCLHVALRAKLRTLAAGLTPRAVLEKFACIQMIDVHFPTSADQTLIMPRYTQPDKDLHLLMAQMGLELPRQPPPRINPEANAASLD